MSIGVNVALIAFGVMVVIALAVAITVALVSFVDTNKVGDEDL